MSTALSSRKPKWHHHPPPPPTPRILHFPRRPRRRLPSSSTTRRDLNSNMLGTLFDREKRAPAEAPINVPMVMLDRCEERRERVIIERGDGSLLEEEKWKFQVEMLRAECNLLRMEKEIAVKKLERTRSKMERTLRSAVHTLVSGRIKICEGKNIDRVLDEEIHELTEKLKKLQKRSTVKDFEGRRNNRNFDKQVSVLQRRLEKIGGPSEGIYLREFEEMENVSFSVKKSSRFDNSVVASGKLNVEILRRKMEGLSKGILLERMEEEYNSLLLSTACSSASTSKRVEFQVPPQEKVSSEANLCSGHCKTIVRRIVEQVRVETEQWSQMQEMLGQVREEVEELQASRDFWKDRALHSDSQIQSLHNDVQEWKQRALSSESKKNEIEAKLSMLCVDFEKFQNEQNVVKGTKCPSVPLDTQKEFEKRIVVCSSKENRSNVTENRKHSEVLRNGERKTHAARGGLLVPKRMPFRDIGNNSSSLTRQQNGKAVFPLHCHISSNGEKTYHLNESAQ